PAQRRPPEPGCRAPDGWSGMIGLSRGRLASVWPLMGRAPRRRLLVALVAGLGLVMSGCARHAPQDTLKPAGSAARSIDHLFTGVFLVAVLFFILVEGGILFIILRYRHRDDRPEPVQVHGNTRLEVGWTIVPALILLVVGGFTFKVL